LEGVEQKEQIFKFGDELLGCLLHNELCGHACFGADFESFVGQDLVKFASYGLLDWH